MIKNEKEQMGEKREEERQTFDGHLSNSYFLAYLFVYNRKQPFD